VGIVVFGLVPELIGRGLGGALLTRATELAWELAAPGGRVWVQTSSHDHPHALRNYERRGFRAFRTEAAD
jgi:GNAT superfamily N-acetyltransferase